MENKRATLSAITSPAAGEHEALVHPLRVLGKGRAAQAMLVEVESEGRKFLCVEKIFRPGVLTRLIYWFFYQSPFPYRLSREAIEACFYRRRVAAKLLAAEGIEIQVAEPYYVRWDDRSRAFVLAAEYVEGRGLKVDPLDDRLLRRRLRNHLVYPIAKLMRRNPRKERKSRGEAATLIDLMRKAEKLFRSSGLIGSGWQVSPAAIVSTANFINRKGRFVLVDVESGVPSLLVPYYVIRGLLSGLFPLFDDVDEKKLRAYVRERVAAFETKFGKEGCEELRADVDMLIATTAKWKAGEVALLRHNFRLFSPSLRESIKEARTECWFREGILDEEGRKAFSSSRRFFTTSLFLLGFFPGRPGRFLRKLKGNKIYRRQVKCFFSDRAFRRQALLGYVDEHGERWKQAGRIPEGRTFERFGPAFVGHLFLARLTPAPLHRFLSDGERRKKIFTAALLFLVSEKFQTEYAKYVIFTRMMDWQRQGRLQREEVEFMKSRVEDGSMQEYVRGFGLHVSLKFLEPVTSGIKIIGTAWFFKTFVSLYPELNPHGELTVGLAKAFIGTFLHNPLSVILMINTSVWRTMITLWRMLSPRRRHISYKVALTIGIIPAFGSLAYPLQMYWRCRELSVFLIRYILAMFAWKVPIYGGKHTRTEVWVVRAADLPAEAMEMAKAALSWIKRPLRRRWREPAPELGGSSPSLEQAHTDAEELGKKGRLDGLVDEMVARIWDRYEREYAGEGSR